MKRLVPLAALLLSLAVASFAQIAPPVPSFLTFQGRLAKPDGTPVADTTTQNLTFTLFDASTNGHVLWQQTSANVTVHNGVFSANLNFAAGFKGGNSLTSVFANPLVTPYLEIKVGGDPPLTPRQPFASNAYAFVANTALTVPDGSLTAASIAGGVLMPGSAAGGDLTGTYPSPSLITDAMLLPKVSNNLLIVSFQGDQSQLTIGSARVAKRIWQSFTPSQSGKLTGLDILLVTITGNPETMNLSVYAGEGIAGALLYSSSITVGVNYANQHFDLRGALPSLQSGSLYTFAVTASSMLLNSGVNVNNPYPSGRCDYSAASDLIFQTYSQQPEDTITLHGDLVVNNQAASQASLVLSGQEFYQAGHIDTNGIAFLAGVNRANDRQLWIADSGNLTQNATNPAVRIWPNNQSIDAIATDGNTLLNLTLQGNGGNLGVGTYAPAYKLDVAGVIRGNNVSVSSDARWKTNVRTLDNALEDVLNLRGVTYDWDRDKWAGKNFPTGRQIGFLAQEVEKVFPELVLTDNEGYKSVLYQNAIPVLVEAMKTLNAKVDRLQSENAELRKQNAALAELAAEIAELKRDLKQKR